MFGGEEGRSRDTYQMTLIWGRGEALPCPRGYEKQPSSCDVTGVWAGVAGVSAIV